MRGSLIALAFGAACLAGCIHGVGTPVTLTNSQSVAVAKGEYGFEATYNLAAKAYLSAEPSLSPTVKAQAKAILAKMLTCPADGSPCTGILVAARTAADASDASTLTQQIGLITTLVAQVNALLKPGA